MSSPAFFDKIILSWDDITEMIDTLADQVFPPGGPNKFDTVIGMQRGGVIVGTLLESTISGYSKEPPEISFIPAIHSDNHDSGVETDECKYLEPCVKGKNVLLIDDVVVSGKTMLKMKKLIENWSPKEVSTLSLLWFDHSAAGLSKSHRVYVPDTFIHRIRKETIPPWRPFPTIGVPRTIDVPYHIAPTFYYVELFSRYYGYTFERQDNMAFLTKELDSNTIFMFLLMNSIGRITKVRIYGDIVIGTDYDAKTEAELQELRRMLAQREFENLAGFLLEPPTRASE